MIVEVSFFNNYRRGRGDEDSWFAAAERRQGMGESIIYIPPPDANIECSMNCLDIFVYAIQTETQPRLNNHGALATRLSSSQHT